MTDFKNGEYVEDIEFRVNFYLEPGGGCSFPCDENGNPDTTDKYYECWKDNYEQCMAHPEKYPVAFNEIEKRVHRWREPNSGICECGKRIELYNEYLGASECPYCGRWHNMFGQLLNDPSTWSRGDDW